MCHFLPYVPAHRSASLQPRVRHNQRSYHHPKADLLHEQILLECLLGGYQKTCIAYGGKYDAKSGFSEWDTKLVLDAKSPNKIAGTLIGGTGSLQFRSALDGKSALQSFIIKSGDMSFSITASPTVQNQFEIRIRKPQGETVYVYRNLGKNIQVIKGTKESVTEVIDKWDALLLFPLLSYKLGVEMGVTGNIYPASLLIHGVALSVATKKHCQVYKMRDRDSDYPHEPGNEHGEKDAGTITPVGRILITILAKVDVRPAAIRNVSVNVAHLTRTDSAYVGTGYATIVAAMLLPRPRRRL